jgi:biopolymer transport protein ExbD
MTWRVRNQNSSADAMEFSAEQLKQMLQSGLMGEQQQFLPSGQPEDGPWLSAFQALIQLNNEPNSSDGAASRAEGTKAHGAGQSRPAASSPTQESSSTQWGVRQKKVQSRKPRESRTTARPKQQRVPSEKRSATGKGRSTDDDPTPVTSTGKATSESSAAATGTAASAVTPVPTQRRTSEPAGASLNFVSAGNGPGGGAGSATLRRSERRLWAAEDEEDELEITPMIDMTFLLLIFFMVTSSVTAMATLELPNSRTGRSEKTEERVVLVVDFPAPLSDAERTPMTGSRFIKLADARLYFQNEPERVFPASQIDSELKKSFQEKPGSRFVLQANRKMPVGVVRQLIKSAAQAGAAETLVGVSMPR